jgi:ATP-dependent protease Clp ATPase subunit
MYEILSGWQTGGFCRTKRCEFNSFLAWLALGVMFDAPDNGNIAHVKFTRQVVRGESQPIVRRKQDAEAA